MDFTEKKLEDQNTVSSILVGPEGGFSQKEREMLKKQSIVGLKCNTILRSETAVVTVASKILA